MKTLYLLRHAKSSKDDLTIKDHDRPINSKGKDQCESISTIICDEKIMPNLIISSSALRAKQTAEIVAKDIQFKGKLELNRDLYEAKVDRYMKILKNISDDYTSVMLVGHNPTHEEFLAKLISGQISLSTASLVCIELSVSLWKEINADTKGRLIKILTPG